MIPISMHSNIFFILKKKNSQDSTSPSSFSLSFFFSLYSKIPEELPILFFFPFTPFILELIHIRFCSHHFTYQYGWVAKSRGDCSCKVLFYWISSFFQPLNNAVSWASDSLTLPCQSPPVSWLCIPIFRMMTPKLISHLSSEVQSPISPWMFKRCHKPHTSKAELFMPYSLWPKLLLPQSSLSHSCSILLIPQCKILNIIFFLPSLSHTMPPAYQQVLSAPHHVILHFQTLAAVCLITSHNYQLSPRLLK